MGKNAYGRNNDCAKKPNHYDFQMGGAIRAVDRMAHAVLPPSRRADSRESNSVDPK
jgi:hypothetical protein